MPDRFYPVLFALSALAAALCALFGPDDWFPKSGTQRIGLGFMAVVFTVCVVFAGPKPGPR